MVIVVNILFGIKIPQLTTDMFPPVFSGVRVTRSLVTKNRQHNGQKTEEQTTQWPKDRRTDNTMAKRQKNRQHKSQKKKYKRTNNDLQNLNIKQKIE
jgi:hypothetical protein